MQPYQGGGDMIKSVTFEETIFNDLPYKFEAGTPNIAGAIGLGAAIRYVNGKSDWTASRPGSKNCSTRPPKESAVSRAYGWWEPPERKRACCPSSSMASTRMTWERFSIAKAIAVRTGHHCAQPVMDRFKVPATTPRLLRVLQHKRGSRRSGSGRAARQGDLRLMLQLRDLYQELIVDHSKNPRNFGSIDDADRTAKGFNPLCGDKLKLFLKLNGDVIEDVRFEGSGCAISTASASIMCQTIKGQTLAQAEALFETFHFMLTGPKGPATGAGASGQAGRLRRGERLSGAREMRHAGLAHTQECVVERRGRGKHGIAGREADDVREDLETDDEGRFHG